MTKAEGMTKAQVMELPADVQMAIMDTLKAFKQVYVSYENGSYNASTAVGVKATYQQDHKFVGIVYADNMYTIEERTENYIECFHDYPIWYKGERDYMALKARFNK
jgi:hypothetical protein